MNITVKLSAITFMQSFDEKLHNLTKSSIGWAISQTYVNTKYWGKQYEEVHENIMEEVARLKSQLDAACHIKADDKVGFDFAVLDRIGDLEKEVSKLRKTYTNLARLVVDWYSVTPDQDNGYCETIEPLEVEAERLSKLPESEW